MTIATTIVLISWATFLLYWGISSLSVKRDITTRTSRLRWWYVRGLLIAGVLVLWYHSSIGSASRHIGPFSKIWMPTSNIFLSSIGAALTALGIALAIWARMHLGRNWSSHPTLKEGHELVTSGPYKVIRHPIYTGMILAALGSSLVSISAIIVFIMATILFVLRIKKEERLMNNQFPTTYPEYKKNTWALIPYVW